MSKVHPEQWCWKVVLYVICESLSLWPKSIRHHLELMQTCFHYSELCVSKLKVFFYIFFTQRHSNGWPHPQAYVTEDCSATWRPFQYLIPLMNHVHQGIQQQQFGLLRLPVFYYLNHANINRNKSIHTANPLGYAATHYSFPWIHIHYIICLSSGQTHS